MGDLWRDMKEGSSQIAEAIGWDDLTPDSREKQRKIKRAAEASRPRKPALSDDEAMRQIETDRLRRSKGVLATIYGGKNPSTPDVAVKELLG